MRSRRTSCSRPNVAAVVGAVALASIVGCQTLVGIEGSSVSAPIDAGSEPTATGADATASDADTLLTQDATTPHDAGADVDGASSGDADGAFDADCVTPIDAGVLADASDAATCTPLARRCSGNTVQECSTGAWVDVTTCSAFCRNTQCETPPSCSGITTNCGPSADPRSCCSAHLVEGGSFTRDFDGVTAGHDDTTYKATVTSFVLDDFEVTVERFKRFVDAYPASASADGGAQMGSLPVAGSGKNASDPTDVGWQAAYPLPADRAGLIADLTAGVACDAPTWGAPTQLPLACATYYEAYAFCIWDGGRLPTEAEWNYAAAGGGGADGKRVYPFSDPPSSLAISPADAVYAPSGVLAVGAKLPRGQGKWKQADLAGNLTEWVRDSYAAPYAKNPCVDCADFTAGTDVATRGGDFTLQAALIGVAQRSSAPPDLGFSTIGFRCARSK